MEARNHLPSGDLPHFRRMTLHDIQAVQDVEVESFTLPWSAKAFYNELVHNHFSHYIVAEYHGKIVGYGGMWVIMDEAHITNIAILHKYRGHKWGERLLLELIHQALDLGARRMTLEVRVSNTVALSLYKKLGFYSEGVRKGYYSDNQEDALVMWADIKRNQGEYR